MKRRKTHESALVIIPPEAVWEPIQAIRRRHDRKLRRWMPHITLLYPFRPRSELERLEPSLEAACAELPPLAIELAGFRFFSHPRAGWTLWLEPRPAAPLIELNRRLEALFPDCDDARRHPQGFTPHLSVGQVRGSKDEMLRVLAELEARWKPLSFRAEGASVICRDAPPRDVFQVHRLLPFEGRE
jgi:2'-5' RNA ligase